MQLHNLAKDKPFFILLTDHLADNKHKHKKHQFPLQTWIIGVIQLLNKLRHKHTL